MPASFTNMWILWPMHELLSALADEFVVGGFRLRVQGNTLQVEAEDSEEVDPSGAQGIADRYAEALRKHLPIYVRLLTVEEFMSIPPQTQIIQRPPDDRLRARQAVSKVRSELLASGDPALCRCYNYVQKAMEKAQNGEGDAIFHLYKAIETVQKAVGGEKAVRDVLGVYKELKSVKRMANDRAADQRHAPDDPSKPPIPADHGLAMQHTLAVVRAYERYVQRLSKR